MHTLDQPGIDVSCVNDLTKTFTWVPFVGDDNLEESEKPDAIVSVNDVDAEFDKLDKQNSPAGLSNQIRIDQVYDLSSLDAILAGKDTVADCSWFRGVGCLSKQKSWTDMGPCFINGSFRSIKHVIHFKYRNFADGFYDFMIRPVTSNRHVPRHGHRHTGYWRMLWEQ